MKKILCGVLLGACVTVCGSVSADQSKQYTLVDPAELQKLKTMAAGGYNKRSVDTLRHMYRAAALTGLLAKNGLSPDVTTTAKALGDEMVKELKNNGKASD